MESNNLKEVNAAGSNSLCVICEKTGHSTENCHTIPAFREVHQNPSQINAMNFYNRPQNDQFSQRYNKGWRNHPNFDLEGGGGI